MSLNNDENKEAQSSMVFDSVFNITQETDSA